MPLVHFDLPSIFQCIVELGSLRRELILGIGDDFRDKQRAEEIEEATDRLADAFIPYPETASRHLARSLLLRRSPTENGEEMEAHVRLMQDCGSAVAPGARKALLDLSLLIPETMRVTDDEWEHPDERKRELRWWKEYKSLGGIAQQIWEAMSQEEKQPLRGAYEVGADLWKWPDSTSKAVDDQQPTGQPDTKPDKSKEKPLSVPSNKDVLRLCKKLKAELKPGVRQADIAREFAEHDEQRAETLLRQARRYRHLWE